MEVYVDAGDGMAALGEVAVWTFDLEAWGECAQAATEEAALQKLAARVGVDRLRVAERITGSAQVFDRDRAAATDAEVDTTLRLLRLHRDTTLDLVRHASAAGALDVEDAGVAQPAWMPWRTPRSIAQHLADDAAGGYLKRAGLPTRPSGVLIDDLRASAEHVERVLRSMPRDLVAEYRGETWTTVKLLRRQAWHERVEHVFLRRRLRAAGAIE